MQTTWLRFNGVILLHFENRNACWLTSFRTTCCADDLRWRTWTQFADSIYENSYIVVVLFTWTVRYCRRPRPTTEHQMIGIDWPAVPGNLQNSTTVAEVHLPVMRSRIRRCPFADRPAIRQSVSVHWSYPFCPRWIAAVDDDDVTSVAQSSLPLQPACWRT